MLGRNVSEAVVSLTDKWENYVDNMSGNEIIAQCVFWVVIAIVIQTIHLVSTWILMADTELSTATSSDSQENNMARYL